MLQETQPVVATRRLTTGPDGTEVLPGTIGTVECRCAADDAYDVLFYICPGHRCLIEHLTDGDIAALTAPGL